MQNIEIKIKHFIAYLTYNNNGDSFNFEHAHSGFDINRKIPVTYTTGGIAVFRLDRVNLPNQHAAKFKQKMEFYRELQAGLTEEFGHGFGIAMAPESDCSDKEEIASFCLGMKKMDAGIATIVFGNASSYIPQEEEKRLRSLSDEWRFEPYHSQKILCGIDVVPRQSSVPALFKNGIDYVANWLNATSIGYKIINELLNIDPESLPENDFGKDIAVVVNPEQAVKIQQIADKAFCKAMNVKYEPREENTLGLG